MLACKEDPVTRTVTPRTLAARTAWARNVSLTYGGKTPLELATGRRPPDLFDLERANPSQLTEIPPESWLSDQKVRRLALQAHLEVRQSMDLRSDLAAELKASQGPFQNGEHVWYFEKDPNKFQGGVWLKGKIQNISKDGLASTAVVDLGYKVVACR